LARYLPGTCLRPVLIELWIDLTAFDAD